LRAHTVLLFDIDGTLVTTGGAGRRAMDRAFEVLTGRGDATHFPFAGMTDRAIVRAGLVHVGHDDDDASIERLLSLYVELLEQEVSSATEYAVYPGIIRALDAALGADHTAIGLGTGNLRRGARIKLSKVELYERFAFGGFGCDHEDRAQLLRTGAERGAELFGRPLGECRVVVIGDTVRDVDAGLAIGADVVAVGTGGEELAVLRTRGAHFVFRDLDEPGAIEALLG
jgi:phosphoglycolate phosphatase-like HAD superfamily hydrolase